MYFFMLYMFFKIQSTQTSGQSNTETNSFGAGLQIHGNDSDPCPDVSSLLTQVSSCDETHVSSGETSIHLKYTNKVTYDRMTCHHKRHVCSLKQKVF